MLLKRILAAVVLAPLVILLIWFGSSAVFSLIAAAAFLLALWEWLQLSGVKSTLARGACLVVGALLFAGLWSIREQGWQPLIIVIGVIWWAVACFWLRHFAFAAAPTPENRALKVLAGVLVIFPAWVAATRMQASVPHGQGWTLLALLTVWAADIGAYFSGRSFGKRKLAPQISPGKTWAGACGALVAGMLAISVGGWLLDVRGARLAGLAVLGAVTVGVSIVGDLLESLMKRHAQVKDSGNLIPGHGGLMDRLDSVFAALPVFVAGLMLLDLPS